MLGASKHVNALEPFVPCIDCMSQLGQPDRIAAFAIRHDENLGARGKPVRMFLNEARRCGAEGQGRKPDAQSAGERSLIEGGMSCPIPRPSKP